MLIITILPIKVPKDVKFKTISKIYKKIQNNLLIITITWFDYTWASQSKLIIRTSVIVLSIFVFQDTIGNREAFANFDYWFKPEQNFKFQSNGRYMLKITYFSASSLNAVTFKSQDSSITVKLKSFPDPFALFHVLISPFWVTRAKEGSSKCSQKILNYLWWSTCSYMVWEMQ